MEMIEESVIYSYYGETESSIEYISILFQGWDFLKFK